jgi:uncharacterized RDD family membrane protein YckC
MDHSMDVRTCLRVLASDCPHLHEWPRASSVQVGFRRKVYSVGPQDNAAPAGWYADPSGQPGHRWWDGTVWLPRSDEATSLPHKWLTTVGGGRFVLASWWRRAVGLLIDGLILYIVTVALQMAVGVIFSSGPLAFGIFGHPTSLSPTSRVIFTSAASLGGLVYAAIFLTVWGQTLGMMAVHARAIDLRSGNPLTPSQAWRRQAAVFFLVSTWSDAAFTMNSYSHHARNDPPGTLIQLVGFALALATYLWPLGNSANQTLQDKVVGSMVILDHAHSISIAGLDSL